MSETAEDAAVVLTVRGRPLHALDVTVKHP
jgi:hypothetical protein